ncbi:MAG TPA: hypothetical protein VJI75_03205 [Candidatus Nanoarchaeia archaeon]|nr:hypothetical protein [Candidatus Nanoarchaeia archaeon]
MPKHRPTQEQHSFLHHLLRSYRLFWQNAVLVPWIFTIDLLFFVAFAVVYSLFAVKIVDILLAVQQMISQLSSSIDIDAAPESLTAVLAQKQAFSQYFTELIYLFVELAAVILVLWILFQAVSWHLTRKAVHGVKYRTQFWQHTARFGIVTLFWFALVLLFTYLIISFSASITSARLPLVKSPAVLLFSVMLTVVLYFVLVSYSFVGRHSIIQTMKNTFFYAFKRGHHFAPAYLILILKIAIVAGLAKAFNLSMAWTVIATVSLFILALAWARFFFIGVAHELDAEESAFEARARRG